MYGIVVFGCHLALKIVKLMELWVDWGEVATIVVVNVFLWYGLCSGLCFYDFGLVC